MPPARSRSWGRRLCRLGGGVLLSAVLASASAQGGQAAAATPGDAFTLRVNAAKQAMMTDPGRALAEATRAGGLAGDARERRATALWLQGEALLRLNRVSEAGPVIEAGLVAASGATGGKLQGDLLMARAGVLAAQGQVQSALRDYQSAFRVFAEAKQPRSQAIALQNIGSIYQDAGDHAKVTQYFSQSAEVFPADAALVLTAHNNMGRAYQAQGRIPEALAEFRKSLTRARAMQSPLLEAHILTNLASAEIDAGDLRGAERHLRQALAFTEQDPSAREWRGSVLGVMAALELKRGRPRAAIQRLEETFAGMELDKTTLVERDFHRTAYAAYDRVGDSRSALAHLQAFKRLDDEARDVAASTNAALMAAQFDYANQSSRIAQLKAGQLERDVKLGRFREAIITGLAIGSVLIALLLAAGALSLRRSRNQVRSVNGRLTAANLALEKALAARTEFLATTSHEIRTPLNGILGMTQVILKDRQLDPQLREKVDLVHSSGETMRALVDDLLDAAKIEQGMVSIVTGDVDLVRLCEQTSALWRERAQEKGLALSLDTRGAPKRIVGDEARLRQILFNLLSNAIKFTPQGQVGVKVSVEGDADAQVLALAVSDSGIGLAPEWLETVFEPFAQVEAGIARNYGGTGLGLSICRNLARAMGGDITLQSAPGQGSTFTLRLPLARSAGDAQVATADRAVEFSNSRLLVVDPNPLSQAVLRALLQPRVRIVEVASCLAATGVDAAAGWDLILVEAAVLGADLEQQCAALRSLAPDHAPVCVLIGGCDGVVHAGLLAAGAAQVIAKPVTGPVLIERLVQGAAMRAVEARGLRAA